MVKTDRWASIQALRGIAVLGVVAFHSLSIEKKYSGGDLILPGLLQIGQSGVDLFFVISGFVMVAVTKGRFGCDGEILRFIWHRVARIYPTYWFYFLLTLGIFMVKPAWVNASQGHHAQLLTSFLLFPSDQLPLVMVAWSLVHEVWFYAVFAVLLRFKEAHLARGLVCWAAVVIGGNALVPAMELPAVLRIALHPLSIEFIIGALIAIRVYTDGAPMPSVRHGRWLVLGVLCIGAPFIHFLGILQNDGLLRVGTVGPLYGALLLALTTLERNKAWHMPNRLVWVGNISYTIYLSHILVLSAVGRLWAATNPEPANAWDNVLAFGIMWGCVLGYGRLGHALVEQPLSRAFLRLRSRPAPGG